MSELDHDRFRKLCGMLGSEHDGERAAAALKATELLKASGKTWADVAVNGGAGNAAMAEMFVAKTNELLWRRLLEDERTRTTDMANEMLRLKREIDRLKGMWPKGEPDPERDDDKALRRRIADAVEACARGEVTIADRSLKLFRRVMLKENWTATDRGAVESALKWVRAYEPTT